MSDFREWPALIVQIRQGTDDIEFVKHLLEAGANPNLSDAANDEFPLMWAAYLNHRQTLRLLLKRGGNIMQADRGGAFPLHFAVVNGNPEAISLLLEAGAEINTPGTTPLHTACWYSHMEAARILIQHHASLNRRDIEGRTPLDVALTDKATVVNSLSTPQFQNDVIELLRKAGAKTGQELDAEAKH